MLLVRYPMVLFIHDILHTEEISDHDAPYVIFNIKKEKHQPCYKFIYNEKTLDMNGYTSDFQQLPLNLVYSFDDPEDQVLVFNKSVVDCINTHAPLRKVKWRHFTISSYHQHIHWQYSFPSTWKIIDVCPVPKVDHAKDITEFRQISILCI